MSGLVDGDDWADALKKGTLTTDADTSSGVGTYDIIESEDDPFTSPLGYRVQVMKGTLEVTQRPITVTADLLSKVYGDADPALTYTITSGKLVGNDTLSGRLSRDAGEDVGIYIIRQGTLGNPNYAITYVPGTFAIVPATPWLTELHRTAPVGVNPMMKVCQHEGEGISTLRDVVDCEEVRGGAFEESGGDEEGENGVDPVWRTLHRHAA